MPPASRSGSPARSIAGEAGAPAEEALGGTAADLELLDSRLWLRIGKQSIVWGKTELFRTTDQFNPQDIALASLPSLEESRVALWAARCAFSSTRERRRRPSAGSSRYIRPAPPSVPAHSPYNPMPCLRAIVFPLAGRPRRAGTLERGAEPGGPRQSALMKKS